MAISEKLQEVLDCYIDTYQKEEESVFARLNDALIAIPIDEMETELENVEESSNYSTELGQARLSAIVGMSNTDWETQDDKVFFIDTYASVSSEYIKALILNTFDGILSVSPRVAVGTVLLDMMVHKDQATSTTVLTQKYTRLVNGLLEKCTPCAIPMAVGTITFDTN